MVDSETLTPLHESNQEIEVSVVIPCLNEAQSVGICVKKARNALKRLGICGEVVVADNGSTDGSAAIAEREGACVVHQPVRGYGSAYLAGIGAAQGKYIIMGDADDTYDFSNLEPFITPLRDGFDFVIGSRFQGNIHPGAMSWSHRYVGNPILSGILNLFFGAGISDSHCGMRSFTRDAFERMKLQTLGMEFASEMVMRAIKGGLKVLEIPIDYYPRKGESKLNSFRDAWRHLRFMLLYSPTYLFLIPGALLFLLGLLCTFLLLPGPVKIGGHAYDVHVMTVTSLLTLLGYQILHVGIYAKTYALRCGFEESDRFVSGLYQIFNLERGLVVGGLLFLFGFAMDARIAYQWVQSGFGPLDQIRPAILASVFMVLGVQTLFSAFFLSLLGIETQNSYTQEMIALNLGRQYSIPTVALRYSITQGPRQSFFNAYSGILRIFCTRLMTNGPPLLYEDGQMKRDYVHVDDVARANLLVMEKEEANYQVYNVGSGIPTTQRQFASALARKIGVEVAPIIPGEFRLGDVRHIISDVSRLVALGWRPRKNLDHILTDYLSWIQTQRLVKDYFIEAEQIMKATGAIRSIRED